MKIVGCDLHAKQQTIAIVDTETGEFTEKTLAHEGNKVREFYAALTALATNPNITSGNSRAVSACTIQNRDVSSSATRKTGAPPDEIETAFPIVCLPPSEAAHCSRTSIEGK
jgi:hypothetical protein